jgi:hypothetical protein
MRYVLGPGFDFSSMAPVPVDLPKQDAKVDFLGLEAKSVRFSVPTYDPAVTSRLLEISVYLVPSGTEINPVPEFFVGSTFAVSTAPVGTANGGFDVNMPLPEVLPGPYFGQVVYGYED